MQAKRAIASFWRIGKDELPLVRCRSGTQAPRVPGSGDKTSSVSAGPKGTESIAQPAQGLPSIDAPIMGRSRGQSRRRRAKLRVGWGSVRTGASLVTIASDVTPLLNQPFEHLLVYFRLVREARRMDPLVHQASDLVH